jgi:hypothetical protein
LRLNYTTGLSGEQLDELVARVEKRLPEPWDKGRGRKKKLSLRDAVAVTVAYLRHNSTEELLGERFEVAQSNISDKITYLTPLVADALEEFVPTEDDAAEMVAGRVCLLDGSLAPCWSWAGHRELWSGKHDTTGNNFLLIANLSGDVLYVTDPLPGSVHDMTAVGETPVESILAHSGGVIADKGFQGSGYATPRKTPKGGELSATDKQENANISRLRAPVERAIAHLKAWRILHTDYRRPLRTYRTSFRAALGLFFFRIAF